MLRCEFFAVSYIVALNALCTEPLPFVVQNKYYSQTRQQSSNDFTSSGGKSGQSSVRLMESLLRIAQAHTRLMQRDVVSVVDAVMAIHLVAKHSNSLSVSLLGMAN